MPLTEMAELSILGTIGYVNGRAVKSLRFLNRE